MKLAARDWLQLILPGDWLFLVLAALCVALLALRFWSPDRPDRAEVRAGGRLVASLPLDAARIFEVPGPLGVTRIEIAPGRARVLSDPGPRQYCVRQGWLSRNGAVAICAPNQVSLSLAGRTAAYDSLGY
ncbi:MAG: NusG domain II-containing protein [Betaproteobacteria bacterium]|nr:NusG domain II-containing protein [Betaproteobacteria bacterium]